MSPLILSVGTKENDLSKLLTDRQIANINKAFAKQFCEFVSSLLRP